MTFDQLREKAGSLPLEPGVYIMRNKQDQVIYVGKAKKLKNRVSQYFQDTASHTTKTRMMVSKIHHFDVIVAASEFEALVLENSLIKRYMPKYNILLKDDKGYPYLRLNMKEGYPKITLVNRPQQDDAQYFGPFGSRGLTNQLVETIQKSLKLPQCSKEFPRELQKDRVCLHFHMNQCEGWCQGGKGQREYRNRMEQARQLLQGNYKTVAAEIRKQMLQASDALEFETAAALRDQLNAVEALSQKQLVTAGSLADTDVIGYAETEAKACFVVLHYSGGNLLDKEYEVFNRPDTEEGAVAALVSQYYLSRGVLPKRVLLPCVLEDEQLISRLLQQELGRCPKFHVPQRGDNAHLVELANKNAYEEAERITTREEKSRATLSMLERMLDIPRLDRLEAYDISNISGTDTVASMVVFQGMKPLKSAYKKFKIRDLENQDDYASMEQVLRRRFTHYRQGDSGFEVLPDVLLIDGGAEHACVAVRVLQELEIAIPVFGMVKDDRHRTRALVTPEGGEIAIDNHQNVFAFIGTIQEEVHRFAITYHRSLRSKRLRYSRLDEIPGIGPKRKQMLLKTFKSVTAISQAQLEELERLLPKPAALAVYRHFRKEDNPCESSLEQPGESS